MALGILGLAVIISALVTQLIFVPINAVSSFHLPLPLGIIPAWVSAFPGWVVMGGLLLVLAWLVGDR